MEKEKITIFLSHSHKDQDKVRKIRDILESLECEPLIFFLKCLDDRNDELEQFIKEEIKARNIFIYCKSKNAEASIWVQKELDYIKSFDRKRLYTIDIEEDFSLSLISFLQTIAEILKRNRIFVSYSNHDQEVVELIKDSLKKHGYYVNTALTASNDDFFTEVKNDIFKAVKEGVYIFICSTESVKSRYCIEELKYARSISDKDSLILPLIIDDGKKYSVLPRELWDIQAHIIPRKPSKWHLEGIIDLVNQMTKKI